MKETIRLKIELLGKAIADAAVEAARRQLADDAQPHEVLGLAWSLTATALDTLAERIKATPEGRAYWENVEAEADRQLAQRRGPR